jgi:hypothetical protein
MHVDPTPQDAPRPDVDAPTLHAAYAPPMPTNTRCPRCGYVTADVFNCPTCRALTCNDDCRGCPGCETGYGVDDNDTLAPSPTTDEGDE